MSAGADRGISTHSQCEYTNVESPCPIARSAPPGWDHYEKNAPLPERLTAERLTAEEVGNAAVFLASPLARGITGTVLHVDKGYHAMAVPAELTDRIRTEG